jgi:hypothetical protein
LALLINLVFSKYNKNYQVKVDEMGGACSTNVGEEKYIRDVDGKARR